ncbi:MAG: M20 metallopeptidase family protein [Solitalea-like symbiont of Tyrophagus putrescentiae]
MIAGNSSLNQLVNTATENIFPELIKIREHLHTNPELSFQEFNTAKFIRGILDDLNIEWQSVANTGTVALIDCGIKNAKTIALRADIDALPIKEISDKSYASINAGVMHACGHDVHTSCLVGAIKIILSLKHLLKGNVLCIFQPGEEKLPGGASLILKSNALSPTPDWIIGQHVQPSIEAGKVAFLKGKAMASSDEIYITVKGKGGHGAMPQLTIDPIVIAAQIIISLQQIVSRCANPFTSSVLTIGKIQADGATNIIPGEATITGTFRTMDEQWRNQAKELINKICKNTAEQFGAKAEVNIIHGYPYLINDHDLTDNLSQLAKEYLGDGGVTSIDPTMASEDFAFYSQKFKGCFYRLGVGNKDKNIVSPVHTPTFDIDNNALKVGSGLMAYLTIKKFQNLNE